MSELEYLKNQIREIVKEVKDDLEEETTTANIDGYQTPNAFSSDDDEERRKKVAKQLGYQIVDDNIDNITEAAEFKPWRLEVTLLDVSPREFASVVYKHWQRVHKVKVVGSGKTWMITSLDRTGSSADHIKKILGRLYNTSEIKFKELNGESVNETILNEGWFDIITQGSLVLTSALWAIQGYMGKPISDVSLEKLWSKIKRDWKYLQNPELKKLVVKLAKDPEILKAANEKVTGPKGGKKPQYMSDDAFRKVLFSKLTRAEIDLLRYHEFGNPGTTQKGFKSFMSNNPIDENNQSVNEASKAEIIKDLDKAKNDLLKKVDVLIAKKKKLYSDVDIESPMTADEKKLDKDIADLFSQINKLVLQKRNLKEYGQAVTEGKVHFEKKLKSGNIFQVVDRDTKGMRGTQDKFSMQIVDKSGKVIKDLGSHPSLDGAKKFSNSVNEGRKSNDSVGVRLVQSIDNNVNAIEDLVINDKKEPSEVINTIGTVLLNAVKQTIKHKYTPNSQDESNIKKLNEFLSEIKKFQKLVESLINKPSKVGVNKIIDSWRTIWNHKYGAAIALNGKGPHRDTIIESVNEAKVNYDFSERELIRVLRQLQRNASTEVKMIKAFEKALGRKLTNKELFESVNEGKSTLKTKVKSDDDFSKISSLLKDKNIKYAWSSEQGTLIFNNDSDKNKAKSILGDKWIAEGRKPKGPVNRWLELKNDDSMHANKKLAIGLKELKYQLTEVEKFFNWYNKIKNINELDSDNYWKRTNRHIYKIKERLINIAHTIKEIEK